MRYLLLCLLMLASPAFAEWDNGHLEGGQFQWTNGGGDPYTGTLDQAFQLAGITDPRVRNALIQLIDENPNGNSPVYEIQDGDPMGVMISGDGWVARDTVAWPSRWVAGRSRDARVWYWVDPNTGAQYRVMIPAVCGNVVVEYYGVAERCRCEAEDAC
jgi:hypothetical protein